MKKTLTALLLLALFTACDKDESSPTTNYSPMTAGSTWTYQNNSGANYTLTATNRDTSLLGNTFKVFTSTNGINQYRRKSGNDYFRSASLPGISNNVFEELYLKDGAEVNATWQGSQTINAPGIPIPLTATLTYTVKEKGVSRTVGNRTFNNVIHIRLDISVANAGNVGGGDFYYAEGIGMIENAVLVTFGGQQVANTSEILTTYSIQ